MIIGSFAGSLISFRGSLMSSMIKQGHQVIACVPDAGPGICSVLEKMGVEYINVPVQRTGLNPFQDVMLLYRFWDLFRKLNPDILLSYTVKPVIYASLAAWCAGVENRFAMITGLGYAFVGKGLKSRLVGTLVQNLYRLALGRCRRVFFQNPDDKGLFCRLGLVAEKKAVLINGSGVDLDVYQPAPLPERVSFLLIARLLGDKGVREYAEAAQRVRAEYPEVLFRLAGWLDPNPACISKAELQQWVDQGRVEFLGRLDDIRPAMADCSVYVLPSYREGTPRTVLEAMAMGRPVITTDAPGCRETVNDGGNGYRVPVKDAAALARAMKKMIRNPDQIPAMGAESLKMVREKYDVNRVNKTILRGMGLINEAGF